MSGVKAAWKYLRHLCDIRVIYALCGIVLSVIAHELVHVCMHLDDLVSFHLFPDIYTIAAIVASAPVGYDVVVEEGIAYAVSTVILCVTFIDIIAIHDSKSRTTALETVLPSGSDDPLTAHFLERVVLPKV